MAQDNSLLNIGPLPKCCADCGDDGPIVLTPGCHRGSPVHDTELIDSAEAAKFNFTEERMTKIPLAKPMEWYPVKPLFPIGGSPASSDERGEAQEKR